MIFNIELARLFKYNLSLANEFRTYILLDVFLRGAICPYPASAGSLRAGIAALSGAAELAMERGSADS
jgi:hypothetical protein